MKSKSGRLSREILSLAIRAEEDGGCLMWTGPTDKTTFAPIIRANCETVDVREWFWVRAGHSVPGADDHLVPTCSNLACVEHTHLSVESKKRPCIQCGRTFSTWDRTRNQHCSDCKRLLERRAAGT